METLRWPPDEAAFLAAFRLRIRGAVNNADAYSVCIPGMIMSNQVHGQMRTLLAKGQSPRPRALRNFRYPTP